MACYHPIKGYRAPGGQIKFARPGAWEDLPLTISCGQCSGCRQKRIVQWGTRIAHEASLHEKNSFITLTYDEKHLPPGGTLRVEDWQKFAKRVRRYLQAGQSPQHSKPLVRSENPIQKSRDKRTHTKFRFFHCGEYGEKNLRPHYHAAVFGQNFLEGATLWKTTKEGNKLYTSPVLSKLWPLGHHAIGQLTWESGAYVAGYILKKRTGNGSEEYYDGRKPEYATMSRNPGLGKGWYDKFKHEVYRDDSVISRGHEITVPKFYDTQHEKLHPEQFKEVQNKRRIRATHFEEDNTPERLRVREDCFEERMRLLEREL